MISLKKLSNGDESFFIGVSPKKKRDSIAMFYELNHNKGKKYTYEHFKKCGLSERGIYYILARFDERGSVDQKLGAGRPKVLTNQDQIIILNVLIYHKTSFLGHI